AQRAAARGVMNFIVEKGGLQATDEDTSFVTRDAWLDTLRDTLAGAAGYRIASAIVGDEALDEAQKRADTLRQLEGATAGEEASALLRGAVGVGLDLATSGGLVGAARAGAGAIGRGALALPGVAGGAAQVVGAQIAR